MSWAKLDDNFDENPKQLQMSDAAFRVWVCSFTYCARQRPVTGFMTDDQAAGLIRKLGKSKRVVEELVRRRGWEQIEGGYLIHDYDQYVDRGSAERTAAWRARKRSQGGHGDGHGDDDGDVTVTSTRDGYPVPVPVPVQSPPTSDSAPHTPHRGAVSVLTGRFADEYLAFVAELSRAVGRHFRGDAVSRKLYTQRRQDGRSAEELQAAARGVALSAHHMGLNDNGTPYNGPASVLRSKMLDTLIGLGTGEVGLTRLATRDEQASADIAEWARRKDAQSGMSAT